MGGWLLALAEVGLLVGPYAIAIIAYTLWSRRSGLRKSRDLYRDGRTHRPIRRKA
jgi:hypothetical protein